MMTHAKITLLIRTALLAALICAATLLIQIPLGMGGYANLGDGVLLLSACLLSPKYAVAAACIGSSLADVLCGYVVYAPCTLVVKGVMALIVSLSAMRNRGVVWMLLSYIAAELVMAAGYFVYEAAVLYYGLGALAAVPGNLLQGAVGVAVAALLDSVRQVLKQTR